MNHLTDEQTQAYLDGDNSVNFEEVNDHLQICENCRLNLKSYQQIYTLLTKEVELPELSNDFIVDTIGKIENTKDKKWKLFENILMATMYIIGVSISIYFLGTSNLISYFKKIDFSFIIDFSNKIIGNMSFNYIYLIAAILIMFTIELVDRFKIQKTFRQVNQ